MSNIRCLLLSTIALTLVGCGPNSVPHVVDAPRAIPVRPVVRQLATRIDVVRVQSEDIRKQASVALEHGIAPQSPEAINLVKATEALTSNLDQARTEIVQISERTEALTLERDHFYKTADDQAKNSIKLTKDAAIAENRRLFWRKWAIIATTILLALGLLKLVTVYGRAINPLR